VLSAANPRVLGVKSAQVTLKPARSRKGVYRSALSAKKFPRKDAGAKHNQQGRASSPFSLGRVNLAAFNLNVERFLSKLLSFPVEIRLKNVFSLKKKHILSRKNTISALTICRIIYKKTQTFWKLKNSLYLKDFINILSLSFFYHKSELLSNYLADIVRLRRKFFFELKNFKLLLPYFKTYYFLVYGSSLKVNVLGKIFGQRKRRFRCFTVKEGLKFSTQDVRVNLSYSLTHSWNIFGSFGIKV
jgi:hypothetical protein